MKISNNQTNWICSIYGTFGFALIPTCLLTENDFTMLILLIIFIALFTPLLYVKVFIDCW